MTLYSIVPAKPEHLEFVGAHMRQEDVREIDASHGLSPQKALQYGFEHSSECYAGMANNEPFCIFGVVPRSLMSDTGIPWLLATDALPSHTVGFLKRNRKMVRRWREQFAMLENYVDCRNEKAIAWLQWLGFHFDEPKPHGRLGLPFQHFYLEGHYV